MNPFKAFVIDQDENRKVVSRMGTLAAEQLDAGEVTIRVHYSSINYKDALAATGAGKIIRRFPCVGGIDLCGEVVDSADARFKPGDKVITDKYAGTKVTLEDVEYIIVKQADILAIVE